MTPRGSDRPDTGAHPAWTPAETEYLVRSVDAAPSVHNTRPSALVFGEHIVDLHELSTRVLPAHDPTGRDRRISCGAALTNLQLAIRTLGWSADVAVYPDGEQPELVGRIRVDRRRPPTSDELAWSAAIPNRYSYRGGFGPGTVDEREFTRLRAAAGPAVGLHRITGSGEVGALAELFDYAGRVLRADPGYQRELAGWTVREGQLGPFGLAVGIPYEALNAESLPTAGLVHHGTPLPDSRVLADRLARETILVLTTVGDTAAEHVEAGRAVERLWLAAVSGGLAGSILTQPLQLSEVRDRLRHTLKLDEQPHLMIRLGHPLVVPSVDRTDRGSDGEPGRPVSATGR